MIKQHLEFNSLDLDAGWQVPPGYPEGIEQKILAGDLDEPNQTGNHVKTNDPHITQPPGKSSHM